jgi:hypothetical protein
MPKKEISLLQGQIDKLKAKDFDLDAWKKYTIIILARIFGDNSQKVQQIENIEYDYSSWSLRDTSGSSEYLDTCKKLGREILQASIDELNTLGLPETAEKPDEFYNTIMEALEDELKGSQVKELRQILSTTDSPEEKRDKVLEKLKSYGSEVAQDILSHILTSDPMLKKNMS